MSLGATLVIRSYIIIILCCGLEGDVNENEGRRPDQ